MKLYGDYHTHTPYSHGRGTIEENVQVAEKKGLKQIAITDHGFRHIFFGILRKEVPIAKREIEAIKDKYKVEVLFGLETNLISRDGHIDLTKEEEEHLDVVLMGFHKMIYAKSLKDRFTFFLPNMVSALLGHYSQKRIDINTRAYIKALHNNNIDVVTHLGYGMAVDPVEVAKACVKTNTYLELNGKRIKFKPNQMQDIIDTGVMFIVNSDAHKKERVGETNLGMSFVLKYNIPIDRVANLNKLPKFKKHG